MDTVSKILLSESLSSEGGPVTQFWTGRHMYRSPGFLESSRSLTWALTLSFIFSFVPLGTQMWWQEQQPFCQPEEAAKRIDIIASISLSHGFRISNCLPQDFLLHEKQILSTSLPSDFLLRGKGIADMVSHWMGRVKCTKGAGPWAQCLAQYKQHIKHVLPPRVSHGNALKHNPICIWDYWACIENHSWWRPQSWKRWDTRGAGFINQLRPL